MASLDDHERRMAVLEERLELEARLRALQDTDQSGLQIQGNVHARLLQAVGTTQSEHGRQLTRLEKDVSEVKSDLGDVKFRLGGVETRLGGVETRLGGVETRLGGVETRLGGVETRLGGVETRLGGVESDLGVVKTGVHQILGLLNRLVDDDEHER
jgi:chromosome segregation ATPase